MITWLRKYKQPAVATEVLFSPGGSFGYTGVAQPANAARTEAVTDPAMPWHEGLLLSPQAYALGDIMGAEAKDHLDWVRIADPPRCLGSYQRLAYLSNRILRRSAADHLALTLPAEPSPCPWLSRWLAAGLPGSALQFWVYRIY